MIQFDIKLQQLEVRGECSKQFIAIVGASGAGKSSFLSAIAGELPANKLLFNGFDYSRAPPSDRNFGYVRQNDVLFPHLSVEQNIGIAAKPGLANLVLTTIIELCEVGDLLPRRPSQLSGGQAQRAILARALASTPQLLLLDESLRSIDSAGSQKLLESLLVFLKQRRIPLLYVTHDLYQLDGNFEHILVLEQGKVSAEGRFESLLEQSNWLSQQNSGLRTALKLNS